MEEKYTVTLKCKNCGNTEQFQIHRGVSWKKAYAPGVSTVKLLKDNKCSYCGVEKPGWERVDLK